MRGLPETSPAAWYALGRSADLAAGAVEHRVFCGEEAVLFRTEAGVPSLAGAFCPHLGAHLAKGGRVCGETLECPFHAFRFAPDGECVDTPTHAPPKRARLKTWPVVERNGLLLAWYHPQGAPPSFEVPERLDEPGWGPLRIHRFELESHPQEISENSVDVAHFSTVHGYEEVEEVQKLRVEGAHLNGVYRMARANPFGLGGPLIRFESDIHVFGLGVSMVNVRVMNFGFRYRLFVMPTPTQGGEIALYIALSMFGSLDEAPRPALMNLIPRAALLHVIADQTFRGILHDVQQDFEIWKNKVYLNPPVLSREDGPIVPYRRYCRQFYPEQAA